MNHKTIISTTLIQHTILTHFPKKIQEKLQVTGERFVELSLNPLSAKLTKWPNTLKQFVGNLPANCLSVFGHFMGFALKGLKFATEISTNRH